MGALSNCLTEVVEEHYEGKQSKLAQAAGVPDSLISRYCKGGFRPDLDRLDKICKALKPDLRAKVAVAHLHDECPSSARSTVHIASSSDTSHSLKENAPNYTTLDRKTRRALEYLAEVASKNADAREALISSAKVLGAEL
jgi:transcriptional regulator with XRE-family HTH domain